MTTSTELAPLVARNHGGNELANIKEFEQATNNKSFILENHNQLNWDVGDFFTSSKATGEEHAIYVLNQKSRKTVTFFFTENVTPHQRTIKQVEYKDDHGFNENTDTIETFTVTASFQKVLSKNLKQTIKRNFSESELCHLFMETVADAFEWKGRSDIHFEISKIPNRTKTRVRVDGDLYLHRNFEYEELKATVQTAYNVIGSESESTIEGSQLDISKSQDAKLVYDYQGRTYSLRVSTLPRTTEEGLDFTCRFLDDEGDGDYISLEQSGYSSSQLAQVYSALRKPNGIIFFVGVTGSGKSASLIACANYLVEHYENKKKLIFIENPVERIVDGVSHINIEENEANEKLNTSDLIVKMGKSLMRSDPDIIGSGEVRCLPTAQFSIQASATGHPCLTTMHVSEATMLPNRLDTWDVKRSEMSIDGLINIIIAQALVQEVCQHCALTASEMPPNSPLLQSTIKGLNELKLLPYLPNIRFASKEGCPKCQGRGRSGRTLVAEVLTPTPQINAFWSKNQDAEATKEWYRQGGFTKLEHAIAKMIKGQLDPEVVSHLGNLEQSKDIRRSIGIDLFNGEV